jgi:hypothetical protein
MTAEAASAAGAIVTFTADATDPEDGVLTPTCEPASGSTFPLGVTEVTCSVTDAEGAQATGSFTVTVVDTTPPELLLPASTTVEATGPDGAVVTYTAAASDLVDGAITPLCAPESGTRFPLGVTTVTCVATDSHGNGSSGAFTIAVVDTTAPVLTLPSNITTAATGPGGAAVTYSASASDVVDGPITPECAPGSGTIFPIGVTTVTCTASDNAGNAAAGSFTITVQSGTVAFASFSAGALIVLRPGTNDDLFAVEALVTPGAGADGINPLTEPVTLVLGTGSWTVAPGAFQRGLFGSFVFSGVVGTTQLGVGIQPLQGGRLLLVAVGSGAELTGVANPVSVAVTIGDDTGATTVTARIR